jgi:hypothetical protein
MELKGVREAVSGFNQVDKAQKGVTTSTTAAGTAADKAEKKTSRLSRAYASLGKTARWGLGFLGVGGIFALKSAIDNTEELSKTTTGLVRNFNLTEQEGSRWAAVAHARAIDSKALSMSFATLSNKMVEAARKGGTALTPFHQLGITQEEVAKGADNFEWGLLRVADALGAAEGGAKRTTAAKALLGKGFQTILPLFSEGSKSLREQQHWADKYGVTLDGKTNDAIMDMVTAQRESKVATLGLQIALTKALMPAIEGGQRELQKFIAILNDDKLTDEQKFNRIEKQFLRIEDMLIDMVTDALPRIAEHGGELGLKMAGAVWSGFVNSDLKGKFVIGAWIFSMFGGKELVYAGAKRIGGQIGLRMGLGLGLGVTGAFIAYEVWNRLSRKQKMEVSEWAENAAVNFVNFFVKKINDEADRLNPLGAFGVDAPNIPEAPHRLQEAREEWQKIHKNASGAHGGGLGGGGLSVREKRQNYHDLWGVWPKGPPPWAPPKSAGGGRPRPREPRVSFKGLGIGGGGGGGRPLIVHNHIHLDGKEVAENTTRHALAAEAFA